MAHFAYNSAHTDENRGKIYRICISGGRDAAPQRYKNGAYVRMKTGLSPFLHHECAAYDPARNGALTQHICGPAKKTELTAAFRRAGAEKGVPRGLLGPAGRPDLLRSSHSFFRKRRSQRPSFAGRAAKFRRSLRRTDGAAPRRTLPLRRPLYRSGCRPRGWSSRTPPRRACGRRCSCAGRCSS